MRCVWTPFSRININMTKWAEYNTWALVPRGVLCTPKSFKCWSSSCCAVRLTCTLLVTRFDFLKPHTYWISLYSVSYETQEPRRGSIWYVALTSGIKRNRTRFTELRTKQTGQNKILAKLSTAHIYNQGHHFIFDVNNAVSKKLERTEYSKAAHITHTLHYFVQSSQTCTFVPAVVICTLPPPQPLLLEKKVAGARYKVNEWI